jgi:hypothetical protein
MVAFSLELWFNGGMLKSEAIHLLGGEVATAAEMLGISYQAVDKWPDALPPRISDRVLGACLRHGIAVPCHLLAVGRESPAEATNPASAVEVAHA